MIKKLLNQSSRFVAKQADKTFVEYFIKGKRPGKSSRPVMSQQKAIAYIEQLEQIAQSTYSKTQWPEETLFKTPTLPKVAHSPRPTNKGTGVEDISWPSGFSCLQDAIARGYNTGVNDTAYARCFTRKGTNRPMLILIHGYHGGLFALEERIWPIDLFLDAGFDVALFVLPHHGKRLPSLSARPLYPSKDVRLTLEGVRQSIEDLRTLIEIFRCRGYEHVGACGMSLGGYITSLLATVEPTLSFAIPMIPLSSFAQWAQEANTLVGNDDQTRKRHKQAIESLCSIIDPLQRPCLIPSDRILVIGGQVDAVTPPAHARALAKHFNAPLEQFDGGHLIQVGRKAAFKRAIDVMRYACGV